jgi:hypothetical protein
MATVKEDGGEQELQALVGGAKAAPGTKEVRTYHRNPIVCSVQSLCISMKTRGWRGGGRILVWWPFWWVSQSPDLDRNQLGYISPSPLHGRALIVSFIL